MTILLRFKKKMSCYPHRYFCRKLPEPGFFSFLFLEGPNFTLTLPFPQGSPQSYSLHLPSSFSFSNFLSSAAKPSAAPSTTCILIAKCFFFFFFSSERLPQQLLTLNLHHDENKLANSTVQGRELRKWGQKPRLGLCPPLPRLVNQQLYGAGKGGDLEVQFSGVTRHQAPTTCQTVSSTGSLSRCQLQASWG